jgi:hypothetical protein
LDGKIGGMDGLWSVAAGLRYWCEKCIGFFFVSQWEILEIVAYTEAIFVTFDCKWYAFA